MESLFRYLSSEHVDDFIKRGEVRFKSLSYFRNYEEKQVRGDAFEGARLYQPKEGLQLNMLNSDERITINGAFESRVKEKEIFVFCLSTQGCIEIARDFKVDACVEILNKGVFIAEIREALQRRREYKRSRLLYGCVDYYSPDESPNIAWALPEKIVMSKVNHYEWQSEYRVAFGGEHSFDVEAVSTQITTAPGLSSADNEHPWIVLKLGSIRRICKVHYFG